MAQVILTKNLFCGYRIRKSKYGKPVFVPDEYVKYLPSEAKIISMGDEDMPEEQKNVKEVSEEVIARKEVLADYDTERAAMELVNARINDLTEATKAQITDEAKSLMYEYGIEPSKVIGTGKDGKITKSDVEWYLKTRNRQAG